MKYKFLFVPIFLLMFIHITNASVVITPDTISESVQTGSIITKTLNSNINSTNETIWLNIFPHIPYFDVKVSPSSLISTNEVVTYPIDVTINIPSGFPAGTYNGNISFVADEWEHNVPVSIEVLEDKNFNVEIPGNISLNVGTDGEIEGTINNKGNTNFNITITTNSSFINGTSLVLYRQTSEKFFLPYNVPVNQTPGIYFIGVAFNNNTNRTMNVSVIDNILPSISIRSIENVSVAKDFTVITESSDNIAIEKVYSDLDCENRNERINHTKIGSEWRAEIKGFDSPQSCVFTSYSVDTSGNINSTNTTFSVTYLKEFHIEDNVDMMKFKKGYSREVLFIKSEEYVNITATLKNLMFTDFNGEELNYSSSGFDMRLKTKAGQVDFDYVGETLQIEGKEIYLVAKGTTMGKFDGVLEVNLPKGYVKDTTQLVNFTGRITTYNTYPDYTGTQLGYDLNCTVVDNGIESQSYTKCILKTPLGNIQDPRRMNYPISIDALKDKEDKYNEMVSKAEHEAQLNLYAAEVIATVFVIFVLFVIYMMFIKPNM